MVVFGEQWFSLSCLLVISLLASKAEVKGNRKCEHHKTQPKFAGDEALIRNEEGD